MLCCIGDSITESTYQSALRGEIDRRKRGCPSQRSIPLFTGHRGSEPYRNSGTQGISAEQLTTQIAVYDIPYTPTDVIYSAGTNDLGLYARTPAQTYAYMEGVRDAIAARWPSARKWLMLIPPNKAPSTRDTTTTNNLLAAMTGNYGIIDIRTGWDTGTMMSADGYHPSTLGYGQIAFKIAESLEAVIP